MFTPTMVQGEPKKESVVSQKLFSLLTLRGDALLCDSPSSVYPVPAESTGRAVCSSTPARLVFESHISFFRITILESVNGFWSHLHKHQNLLTPESVSQENYFSLAPWLSQSSQQPECVGRGNGTDRFGILLSLFKNTKYPNIPNALHLIICSLASV